MSVVIFDMLRKLLVSPIVLSLDLLDACINVGMCLINTRIEDCNFNWGFWWVDYIFFVHFFKSLAPVGVVDASMNLVVSSWSKRDMVARLTLRRNAPRKQSHRQRIAFPCSLIDLSYRYELGMSN